MDHHVVNALAAHRSDESPDHRGSASDNPGRRQDLVDPHRVETRPTLLAVGPVAIAQQ